MQHEENIDNQSWLFVDRLPDDAVDFAVGYGYLTYNVPDDTDGLSKNTKSKRVITHTHNGLDMKPGYPIKLNNGDWKFLFTSKQLAHEMRMDIVYKDLGVEMKQQFEYAKKIILSMNLKGNVAILKHR